MALHSHEMNKACVCMLHVSAYAFDFLLLFDCAPVCMQLGVG